ncbi:hypothetical protein OVS_01730 [Mycoplasma ovis str. Michigan]|uniref:Uncharacterized protein n=1 Tax=Mycoplasma ovis str. Michigan TaxID=1415773 RepID=A0ABM5P1N4_9MOLU|nr:hypothetical protein OVS_01730 [Mycoplasma ovis str. Michigan]
MYLDHFKLSIIFYGKIIKPRENKSQRTTTILFKWLRP